MTTKSNDNNNKKKKNKNSLATMTAASSSSSSTPSRSMEIFETILGTELWARKKHSSLTAENNSGNNIDNSDKSILVKVPLQEVLKDKEFVALYFGAQWSPVSTEFTPRLVDFYQHVNNSRHRSKQPLEVIYVSSDQTQEEFDQHYHGQGMPWTTVVADTPELVTKRNDLIPLFKAFRIPCMVILHGPTGEFITEHGVKDITNKWQYLPTIIDKKTDDETNTAQKIRKNGPLSSSSLSDADHILEGWRTTSRKSIQDGHKLIDYGGGTMSILMLFYRNPYLLCALIAIAMTTSIISAILDRPMVVIGFFFLAKRYLTPKGNQNLPGGLLSMEKR